jgi:malonate transporter
VTNIALALAPVFLLIVAGQVMRRREWVSDAFWRPAEAMTFYVFFPALLVAKIARADLAGLQITPMLAALAVGVLVVALVVVLSRPLLAVGDAGFTSVFQGSFRPNSYVGVAAALALFGEDGLALMIVAIAVVVPLVNLLSVVLMVRLLGAGGNGDRPSWGRTGLSVVSNPLIAACLVGLALNGSGIELPPVILPLLNILGAAALPIGLLAVGAGLDSGAARQAGRLVALTTGLKLILLPLATYAAATAFGVNGLAMAICIMYATLPGSSTSYVMARQMGGDATLLAGIITVTTLVAMAVMPLALMVVT